MKDIQEKLLVNLWAIVAISIIIVCTTHRSSESTNCNPTPCDSCLTEDADDFEGEFLEPSVPVLSTAAHHQQPQQNLVTYNGRYFSYSRKFAYRNDTHLQAAQAIGLKCGPENRAEATKMKNQLREVKTNSYYVVEDLTHSLPYLVPTAAKRLDSIGREFNDLLQRNNLPHYRFRVTSILRSQEDIRRLRRCNSNSIPNSPHNYGTSFDIGYCHFDKVTQTNDYMTDDNLKLALAQVLLNQQRNGHIYVKYEYKQGCFHITTRN